ncbi:signal transducer and activator of transcription 6 isoform X2 [Girardinichthys multiradiatus]|uniref:signal transducer and activator of transcription 6 isoform X2 n=1 Tax=Girardinichthys multiradiatus TaxID=208333 RepID=UPI001FAC26A0|nr:signal transducer and activator of transcription 6 isoform X2 [Girardinichthys multiradiatus]
MAQWREMTFLLNIMDDQTISSLYPAATFPIEFRHYLASWIEEQRWEDFSLENTEQEVPAQTLLNQSIHLLQTVAQGNVNNVVERMKLLQLSKNLLNSQQPLEFAVMVKDVLRKEKIIISENKLETMQHKVMSDEEDIKKLTKKVALIMEYRKRMHQLEEEFNWEKQNYECMQAIYQQNPSEMKDREMKAVMNKIKAHEFERHRLSMERKHLLRDSVEHLKKSQDNFLSALNAWRWEQHKSIIGYPFSDDLNPLQSWSEQLLVVNSSLRQELMLVHEPLSDIDEGLKALLKVLIESSFVVELQPPQVIKTQSKFSATVRYLLGETLIPGKPVTVKAQIINELQARSMGAALGENVGELINNSAVMDKNTATKITHATFRNMSIKKIKRADRKGAESVTEEKFALMFSTDISITGCDTPFRIQMISQPVVIIVHGSQDNNAVATIIWDCAFAEPDRVPFVVPDRVLWQMMVETLNVKFRSEVQTNHELDAYNKHFLAQKIFDMPGYSDDFSQMMVTWCQFNKEVLMGRSFTFWQWFDGAMDLTKKHLRPYWSDGLIFGFIGKQHVHLILKQSPSGTFLLRFSDSEIGGITIAYVAYENGMPVIQNIQPFNKKDLEIRCLGDRIRDIDEILYLYPNLPKHDAFKKYYSGRQQPTSSGYIPVTLQTKVGSEPSVLNVDGNTFPTSLSPDNLPDLNSLPIVPSDISDMDNDSMDQFQEALGALQIPDNEESSNPPVFPLHNTQDGPMEYDFFYPDLLEKSSAC